MSTQQMAPFSPVPLRSVICTHELTKRQPRQPDHEAVTAALITLAQSMANAPERILQELVETALDLCHAHSSGISLLEEENGRKIFRWHGVAGEYSQHIWGTTPREFSPCGTVLDTNKPQLMSHLDRHFGYFAQVEPRIAEALLVPFHVDGIPVGTIWILSHNDEERKFDAEDARILNILGEFSAAAFKASMSTIALRNIVATIREPLLVLDAALRVKSASRAFYENFKLKPDAAEGRLLRELGNGEWDIPELTKLLEVVLSSKIEIENFEVNCEFHSLGPRVMSLTARGLCYEGSPTALILVAIEDITTRKHMEEELLRSSEDAQLFASIAAHDLRAPLNSSVILLQILLNKIFLKDDDRRLLSMAIAGLQRLQGLMNDILNYAQVGGGKDRLPVELQEPVEIALANLQKEIGESGAQVTSDSLPTVMSDRSQLVLVFQNLIGNAVKFRSSEPLRVQISAKRGDREYVVSITDNGQGFEPEYAEQIFLPFKRLHGPQVPGSGIGLASCKRIVERLGGRIWAEASPGKGAAFYFTLPDSDRFN